MRTYFFNNSTISDRSFGKKFAPLAQKRTAVDTNVTVGLVPHPQAERTGAVI